jgi:hydroxymethylpyrimidine/phosphomethylpyrimidine kinase
MNRATAAHSPMKNPNHPPKNDDTDGTIDSEQDDAQVPCILVFNANDPSGCGGLSCDAVVISSVGGHALTVLTGTYVRDTGQIFDQFALDDEAVEDQARAVLEDIAPQAIKVGFVGSAENLSTIAAVCSDYNDVPVVTYMPDLSWWEETAIENYLDACTELLLPQTSVLCGNYSTLRRWLLPDWEADRPPSARDIARAAAAFGVPYTLVTGIVQADQQIDNILASPESILAEHRFERFEAIFSGAGETLCAALAALIANGTDLTAATQEALLYLDQSLSAGFRPGMGHVIPDRMFWATPEDDDEASAQDNAPTLDFNDDPAFHETKH